MRILSRLSFYKGPEMKTAIVIIVATLAAGWVASQALTAGIAAVTAALATLP